MARNGWLKRLGIGLLLLALLGCEGRSPRPIISAPPPPAKAPPLPDRSSNPERPDNSIDRDSAGGSGSQVPHETSTPLGGLQKGPSTSPDSGRLPASGGGGPTPSATGLPQTQSLQIPTTLPNGAQGMISWDGRTFKGNDKWDVSPVN